MKSREEPEPIPLRPPDAPAPHAASAPGAQPGEADVELLRAIVGSIRDYAIFALDETGRVASWSPGAEAIKGWRAEEIVGRHFSVFYPPEDVASGKPDAELRAAAEFGRFEDEGWRLRRDGSRFWANVIITALRTPEGRLRGFAKVTRDFTDRRAAEETARRLVAETAARHAAQEAVAARDDFLAVAGHELRTPLTALLFHADALARGGSSLPPEPAARAACSAASRRAVSSASFRAVRSRVTLPNPRSAPSGPRPAVMITFAQNRVPSFRSRHPSSSNRPSRSASTSSAAGFPERTSSGG